MATSHKIISNESTAKKMRPIVRTNVVYPSPQSKQNPDTLVTINQAIKLISDPHTEQMYERHRLILQRIFLMNNHGFKLRDLVSLYELLNLLAERLPHEPEVYQKPFVDLLYLCKLPLIKELSSDEKTFFDLSVDCFSQLGYLLRVNDQLIRRTICHTLDEFYDPIVLPDYNFEECNWRPTSSNFNRAVLEASDVVESVLLLYSTLNDLDQLRFCTLRVLQKLAFHSASCSRRLILRGAVTTIAENTCKPLQHDELISRSTEFIWSLIDHKHDTEAITEWTRQLGMQSSLGPLHEALVTMLSQDHSKASRGLRNDLLTLLFLLVRHAIETNQLCTIGLVELGLVRLFCQLLTLKRGRHINPLLKNVKLLPNPENFDFIKLLISTVALLIHDPVAVRVMAETHLMDALFDWTSLLHFNPVRISRTPRPSRTDNGTDCLEPGQYKTTLETEGLISEPVECELQSVSSASDENKTVQWRNSSQFRDHCKAENTPDDHDKLQLGVTDDMICEEINDSGIKRRVVVKNASEPTSDNDSIELANLTEIHNVLGGLTADQMSSLQLDPIQRWPVAYQEEMQLHALDALTAIGPVLLDEVIRLNGPNRLIKFLNWCDDSASFTGQGNSFHGDGGRHNKRAQLRYALRLIRSLVDTGDERITLEFTNQGLIPVLVGLIFKVSLKRPAASPHYRLVSIHGKRHNPIRLNTKPEDGEDQITMLEDEVGIEMQCDILLILAKLCELDSQRKSMLGVDGIDTLTLLLSSLSNRLSSVEALPTAMLKRLNMSGSDTIQHTEQAVRIRLLAYKDPLIQLATAVVDAIWCCIVGSIECEDYFLAQNGASYLADLLEWYPRHQCSHLLGCLVDLTENPKCFPYLLSWSGVRPLKFKEDQRPPDGLKTVAQLLSRAPDMAASAALNKLIETAERDIKDDVSSGGEQAMEPKAAPEQEMTEWNLMHCGPTLVELLCHLWRSEETKLAHTPGEQSSRSEFTQKTNHILPDEDSQCDDGSDSVRINIYALFLRLGFTGQEHLTTEDKVTLKKIERYFDLKNSAVWTQIERELDVHEVRPITPDTEMLRRIRHWGEQQKEAIEKAQQELREAAALEIKAREQEDYNRIREIQRYRHQIALDFSDYVARTSNPAYLKAAKEKQKLAIRASRLRPARVKHARRPFSPTPPTTNTATTTATAGTTESTTEEDYGAQSSDSAIPESNISLGTTGNTNTTAEKTAESSFESSTGDQATGESTDTSFGGFGAVHHIDVQNTNVTSFCARTIRVDSTPPTLFHQSTDLEKAMLQVIKQD